MPLRSSQMQGLFSLITKICGYFSPLLFIPVVNFYLVYLFSIGFQEYLSFECIMGTTRILVNKKCDSSSNKSTDKSLVTAEETKNAYTGEELKKAIGSKIRAMFK
ncbi:MAG: hypothetical protein ACLVKO_01525 [Dysgonomonas sp.]